MIQESLSDDLVRTPLKMDGPALPGAQEGNAGSLKECQGIGGSQNGHPLADHNRLRPGP